MRTVLLLISILLFSQCSERPGEPDFSIVNKFTQECLDKSIQHLTIISDNIANSDINKGQFDKARDNYKMAEPFVAYVNNSFAHRVNGPALPVFLEDNGRVLHPVGLQAIEEQIYGALEDSLLLKNQIELTIGFLTNLKKDIGNTPFTAKRFFIAVHQQYLRIISLGITGFDTPTSLRGLEETKTSLQSIQALFDKILAPSLIRKNRGLVEDFRLANTKAIEYLNTHQDFESFDRYSFIKYHLNKITTLWVQLRIASGLWEDEGKYAINYDALTFFESNSFNTDAFRTATNRTPDERQIELGKMLFFEPRLSESENLACVSCHEPSKAYADGLTLGQDKNGNELKRNTPTLINSVFQRAFFWDGRSDNLEAQITNVFTNENEFNAAVHQISTDILTDSVYARQFEAAFGTVRKDNIDIIKAISSYVSTLKAFNSKFDRDIRSDEKLLTDQEIKGMNLFMGKALCSTCHFAPLFNGTVPPNFKEHEKEALGTPHKSDNQSLDDDLGFYSVYEADLHKNMFKTPTVRNVEFTAPYMHNGVYNTLEEVMDFYNRGGGNGLGFSLENQTLPFDSLQLNTNEQQAIIAFMKTLSDTTITGY